MSDAEEEEFSFPSPDEMDQMFLERGARRRVEEILSELAESMAESEGMPGERGRFDFKRDDSETIRQTVLKALQRRWDAELHQKTEGGGHVLIVKGRKPPATPAVN